MKDSIASRFYEKKRIDRLKIKIKMLGINYDPYILLGSKVVITILLFVLLLVFGCGFIISLIIAILFYFLIGYLFIDLRIYLRMRRLENDALEYMPLLLLSMESGRNIKNAISSCSEVVNSELSKEFRKVVEDTENGRSLDEALKELSDRIPGNYINNMILSISEANRLGVSINDSVNRQLALINESRINYEKRLLRGIPIHITILSLICFIAMLAVLVIYK